MSNHEFTEMGSTNAVHQRVVSPPSPTKRAIPSHNDDVMSHDRPNGYTSKARWTERPLTPPGGHEPLVGRLVAASNISKKKIIAGEAQLVL